MPKEQIYRNLLLLKKTCKIQAKQKFYDGRFREQKCSKYVEKGLCENHSQKNNPYNFLNYKGFVGCGDGI